MRERRAAREQPAEAERRVEQARDVIAALQRALLPDSERSGWALASRSAITLATTAREADALELALDNSRTIGMAVGIVIARHNLHQEQGLRDLLSTYSQNHNSKVSDLAEHIVRIGEVPTT